MQVEPLIPYENLIKDEHSGSIPSILHTFGDHVDVLSKMNPGWILKKWTQQEVDTVVTSQLPSKLHGIVGATEEMKTLIYPHVLLYVFGGVYWGGSAPPVRAVAPMLRHFHSSILFYTVASPEELNQRQAVFGISPVLMASAPKIAAVTSLLEIMAQKIQTGGYGGEMHHGVMNQFVKAAMNGSSDQAVLMLHHAYVDSLCAHEPIEAASLPAQVVDYLTNDTTADGEGKVFFLVSLADDDDVIIKGLRALPNVHTSPPPDHLPPRLLYLSSNADEQHRPVDANMDVALRLHEQGTIPPGSVILLHSKSAAIAETSLKMQDCRLVGEWDELRMWQA